MSWRFWLCAAVFLLLGGVGLYHFVLYQWPVTLRATLTGHTGPVRSVAFSPDGTLLASASADKTVIVWDVATHSVKFTLTGHTDEVTAVAFSSDGKLLATGSKDTFVQLWDAVTGDGPVTLTGGLKGWHYPVTYLAFSPDGNVLICCDAEYATVWDVVTKKRKAFLHQFRPVRYSCAAFSADCKTVAVARTAEFGPGTGTEVDILDAKTFEYPWPADLSLPSDRMRFVAFSLDGKTLAWAGEGISLWDVESKKQIDWFRKSERVSSLGFSPDGETLAAATGKVVRLWDPTARSVKATLRGHTGEVHSVAFNHDGTLLASGSADGTVKLWTMPTTEKGE